MDPQERGAELLAIAEHKLQRGELSRRDFLKLVAAFGVVVGAPAALAGCGGDGDGGGEAASAGPLRFLVAEAFWADWNPYGHTAQIAFKIQRNLFDRLVEVQPDMSIRAGLAESWRQLDQRTWEFKLHPDVKFHDGQSFTARDVKASVELASGHVPQGRKLPMATLWLPHEVEVVDDTTARLRGSKPFGPLLNTLAITDMCSADDIAKGLKHLEQKPNGTGAFRLAEDKPARKVLDRFDQHYRGPAKLQQVVWEYIQDPQTRLNALLAGQAHVIDRVEPEQVQLIQRSGGVEAIAVTSGEVQAFWFRQDKKPFADNAPLRRAVAWSLDRQAMVDLVGGKAQLADSQLASPLEFRSPQSPRYALDPERAKAELARAGVSPPVSFELGGSVGFYPKSKEVCELAKQNLEANGLFKAKLTLLELAAWIDMLFGKGKPGELFHGGWGNLTRDPDFAVATLLHSPGAWTGAHDEQTDALIDEGKTTSDPAERGAVYGRLQQRLWEEQPAIPFMYSDLSNGVSDKVSGYALFPTFVTEFWGVSLQA
jgi:peptide/nickel transport system substrate-binding protein